MSPDDTRCDDYSERSISPIKMTSQQRESVKSLDKVVFPAHVTPQMYIGSITDVAM